MNKIRTVKAAEHIGTAVIIEGWLQHHRRHGNISFLVIRDGWGTIQVVCENPEVIEQLEAIALESVVSVQGKVVEMAQAPNGVEIHQPEVRVITAVSHPLPLTINKREIKAALPTQLDHAVFTNRHPKRQATFRLSAGVMAGFRQTLNAQQFTEIQSPKLVASATESGANVFELGYFGRPAYLAQSPQFYKQIMVGIFERVYEVGPVFRAEPHNTSRHINQYVSLDVEFGFIENHFTVMAMLENVITGILRFLATHHERELSLLNVKLPEAKRPFPHIHFSEAKALIQKSEPKLATEEHDLAPAEERWLGEWANKEFGSAFLFVTGYPMPKRPFYTHPEPNDPAYSNSFDLLFNGLELVTGGQRLHTYESYLEALIKAQLSPEPFETYLEAFKFGMPPHGGFAIGLERFLTQLIGFSNVRLATLFPRDINRLTP